MWAAAAPLPYYSAYLPQKRKVSNNNISTSKDGSSPPSSARSLPPAPPPPLPPSAPPVQLNSNTITDLLEPAIDGPPSPERIRALSKQMKRASVLDKHQSSNTTSSGSSSLRSLASDRPSWEQSLDNITLSRRSSGRSTASSMPSRERPESVQLFGKAIFNRRGKLKRESSAHSSSGSSLYSADHSTDGPPSSTRDTFIPAIFNRRRTMKHGAIEEEQVSPKKLHISGPYNFQHVTHTHREHLPNLQRTSRVELVSEFSAHRAAQAPTSGSLKGIEADDLHFSNFSSEAVHLYEDPPRDHQHHRATHFSLHRPPPPIPRQPPPTSAPRRLVKHTRSQEQLRSSPPRPAPQRPPRPPRSPVETTFAPPIPPPRISSRLSMRYDGYDPLATTTLERPQTSGGFRHPKPFSPSQSPTPAEPPTTSHGYLTLTPELETVSEARFSHAITTPDDAAWPLTATTASFSYETVLPDVPEEEESYVLSRRSRASIVSNNSSLRGSQSVPVLRQLAQAHSAAPPQRPASGASDTLGRLDMFAAQRAMRAALQENAADDSLARESWEDDIDYCYEHEADADFEYAWDRPSLDLTREEDSHTPVDRFDDDLPSAGLRPTPRGHSPGLLSTIGHFDMPALSPAASQASTTTGHEAVTPTAATMPVKSNFSHPRMETTYRGQSHLHVRTASQASSFKESHGFHLSPSLLIPGDFRQEMIMADSEMDDIDEEDFITHNTGQFSYDDDPTMTVDNPSFFVQDRASTSTTGTSSSGHTSSSGERHVSTNSTWTTMTRFTGSTSYDGWNPKSDFAGTLPAAMGEEQTEPGSPKLMRSTMSPLPESEEMMTRSTPDISVGSATSPGLPSRRSESRLVRDSLHLSKSKENLPLKHRRQRARTTSLSTPPPPPGQYAIFPPIYAGNRI